MVVFLGILLVIAFIAFFSLIPVWLWFCIDDFLAQLFGNPMVGEIPWYVVWLVFFLLGCIFRSTTK